MLKTSQLNSNPSVPAPRRGARSFATRAVAGLGGTVLALGLLPLGVAGATPSAAAPSGPAVASAVGLAGRTTPARGAVMPAAAGKKTVSFVGHYHGTAALLINNGTVTISSVAGTGSGTLLGASTVKGTGSAGASAQCDPFTGTGSLSSPAGKINMTVVQSKSSGCSSGESGPVTVTFTGVAVAKGGSGVGAGASGSLKFKGTLKLTSTSGSQNGPYTVTLTGKLTVKG